MAWRALWKAKGFGSRAQELTRGIRGASDRRQVGFILLGDHHPSLWTSPRLLVLRVVRMGNSASSTTDLSSTIAASHINETISDNCVVIFSKTNCSYCKMAKNLFRDMNVNYTAVELDMYENGSQFQDILHKMTGGRTVPRIFINGAFVGGATDTQKLHREGKLLPLVSQCQIPRREL